MFLSGFGYSLFDNLLRLPTYFKNNVENLKEKSKKNNSKYAAHGNVMFKSLDYGSAAGPTTQVNVTCKSSVIIIKVILQNLQNTINKLRKMSQFT